MLFELTQSLQLLRYFFECRLFSWNDCYFCIIAKLKLFLIDIQDSLVNFVNIFWISPLRIVIRPFWLMDCCICVTVVTNSFLLFYFIRYSYINLQYVLVNPININYNGLSLEEAWFEHFSFIFYVSELDFAFQTSYSLCQHFLRLKIIYCSRHKWMWNLSKNLY